MPALSLDLAYKPMNKFNSQVDLVHAMGENTQFPAKDAPVYPQENILPGRPEALTPFSYL